MMIGLDTLLAKSIGNLIQRNLGPQSVQRIENRLFQKYGINLTQSIADFDKLDSVLHEFFGAGAKGIENRVFEKICKLEKAAETEQEWMAVEDPYMAKTILDAFGDKDKKRMLNLLVGKSHTLPDILDRLHLSETSGTEKINSLVESGLVSIKTSDNESQYISEFDNVKIDVVKNKILVKVQLNTESVKNSVMIPVIRAR